MSIKRVISLLLVVTIIFSFSYLIGVSGDSYIDQLDKRIAELDKQINSLTDKKKNQQKVVNALQSKISAVEKQIVAYNNTISGINSKINANKAEINSKNAQIAADQLAFKKRLRASYMSNTDNSVRILLGAKTFGEYLQLSQLMKTVTKHDKALIDKVSKAIKELNEMNEENNRLLQEQVSAKSAVVEKQHMLASDREKEQSLLKNITNQTNSAAAEKRKIYQERSNYLLSFTSDGNLKLDDNMLIWPVPGKFGISQYYGNNGHTGVDLSSGGIAGARIVAIASGKVVDIQSGWTSSMGKRGMASYGNYVTIDHGKAKSGNSYISLSAHMQSTAVKMGQYVSQGQTIGYVGTTGNSTGYHLHIELKRNGGRVDPLPYIQGKKVP